MLMCGMQFLPPTIHDLVEILLLPLECELDLVPGYKR